MMMSSATEVRSLAFNVFRGNPDDNGEHCGDLQTYEVPVQPGWVVLDALHWIQAHQQPDLAVRWNCKAAKCGSCAAEVNGLPSLMCKTRLDHLPAHDPVVVRPMRTFPLIKDLVCDVSWNYEVNKTITPFTGPNTPSDTWRFYQDDADRVQEFRKCIECFICQNSCHVLRNHNKFEHFYGPRFMIRLAMLEMHPLDTADRLPFVKETAGIGYCNITKCCTDRCPEAIHITDNAIIPLKERVVDRYYDPITMLLGKIGIKAS